MSLPDITLALFSLFNILRLGSYLPQIIRIAADGEGAKAISYSTWCIWIGANASTAIYAVVNVMDAVLFYVSAFNTVGCVAVVGLTAFKRYHFGKSHQRYAPAFRRRRCCRCVRHRPHQPLSSRRRCSGSLAHLCSDGFSTPHKEEIRDAY
jgi:hypothetical protein